MGVAGRRAGAEAVRLRRRSVRGRPASRDRHRRSDGLRRPFRRERGRRVRRTTAATGPVPDGPNRGRLVGHARPPRLDRGARRDSGRRGRRRRHDRPERRARRDGAVRLSGHPPHGGPERLRRPADASASRQAPEQPPPVAAAVAGAGSGSARGRASARSVALRPTAPRSSGGESTCRGRSAATPRRRQPVRPASPTPSARVPLARGLSAARRAPICEREPFVRASSRARAFRGAPGTRAREPQSAPLARTRTASRTATRDAGRAKRGRVARGGCCWSRSALVGLALVALGVAGRRRRQPVVPRPVRPTAPP